MATPGPRTPFPRSPTPAPHSPSARRRPGTGAAAHRCKDAPAAAFSRDNAAASLSPIAAQAQGRPRGNITARSADGLTQQIVEFAHLDAFDERGDFRSGVNKCRSFWVSRIPDSEFAAAQPGQLDAGPLRVAGAALAP